MTPADHPILANGSARVLREATGRLRCEVPGTAVFVLLLLGASALLGMSGLLVVLVIAGVVPPDLLCAAVMPLLFGAVLATLAWGRRRLSGTFVVDGTARVLLRVKGETETKRWSLDDVVAVRERIDLTDGMRPDLFPGLPHWLEVKLRDGTRMRLAKGGKSELAPVRAALAEAGMPHAAR